MKGGGHGWEEHDTQFSTRRSEFASQIEPSIKINYVGWRRDLVHPPYMRRVPLCIREGLRYSLSPCLNRSFLQHTIRCDRLMDVVPLILGQFSRRPLGFICRKHCWWMFTGIIQWVLSINLSLLSSPQCFFQLPATLWQCVCIKVLTQMAQCYLLFQWTQSTLFFLDSNMALWCCRELRNHPHFDY